VDKSGPLLLKKRRTGSFYYAALALIEASLASLAGFGAGRPPGRVANRHRRSQYRCGVSIHAPMLGARQFGSTVGGKIFPVSIHAPQAGHRQCLTSIKQNNPTFQSMRAERDEPRSICASKMINCSSYARAERHMCDNHPLARPPITAGTRTLDAFQSTRPYGANPMPFVGHLLVV
jgi:hypothetical protein